MTKKTQHDRPLTETPSEASATDDAVDEQAGDVTPEDVTTEDEASELESIVAERDSLLDQLQRTVAEFTNFRRRTEQERANLVSIVRKDVLSQFLPVIDDVERALSHVPEADREAGWVTGFTMIDAKLRGILERSGVTEVNPVNEPFDPSQHEAVATDPGSSGEVVTEVYQKGYRIGDVLVRPAMVKTGDPVESTEEDPTFDA